jgi:tetratricopeptide (TPR) repeat protein
MLYHERGRERDALPVLDRWIHDYPELGGGRPAYLGLVERYGSKSDQRRAIDDTSDWLAAHPDNNNVRAAYLGLVERKGTAEQTERMLQETSTWLVAHPDNNKVRATYLGLLERKGTAKQTERMLQETSTWLAKHPDDSEVRRPYLGLVEQKGTAAQTERVLQETSDWLAAHRDDNSLRATYLGLVGRKGTAAQAECVLQETSAWLVAHPDDTNVRRAYICLVLVDRKQDHLDEPRLRELYDAYIKFYPHDTVIREAWARWLHSRNYRDEAEEVFKALIAEHPRSFPHWYWYGRLLLDMKRYGEAADQFKQVLKIHRGHAMAHDGLALALQGLARAAEESQDHSEAARLFATAERELKNTIYWAGVAHERLAIFYTHLGWLYIDMKRWGDALGAFDQSVNENPEYFGNYWGQGRALMGLEQWHDAASALRTALEKAPDTLGPPASDDIRKLIEQSEAALTDNHPGESD